MDKKVIGFVFWSTAPFGGLYRLRQRYASIRSGRFALNPYHIWFICE